MWKWLITPFWRKPDRKIGGISRPYMLRWHVLPRNRWLNCYLHKFLRDDDDRAMHDHPWWSLSLVIWGGYFEHDDRGCRAYQAPSIRLRSATYRHRIELDDGRPCWTLFFTGPLLREWGFHCPRGWVHWKEFTRGPHGEEVGRGCD